MEHNRENRKRIFILILVTLLTFLIYGIYSYIFSRFHGTFGLTSQGPRHLLAACLKNGIFRNYSDPVLVNNIQSIFAENGYGIAYKTTTPVMQLFGTDMIAINKNVQEFCNSCIRSNPGAYVRYLYNLVCENIRVPYIEPYNQYRVEASSYQLWLDLQSVLFTGVKIGHVYVIGVLEMLYVILHIKKKKLVPWVDLGIASCILVIFTSVYLGTYAEFMRSTIYVLPFTYVGIGLLCRRSAEWIARDKV